MYVQCFKLSANNEKKSSLSLSVSALKYCIVCHKQKTIKARERERELGVY